jgi:hypothetical protein
MKTKRLMSSLKKIHEKVSILTSQQNWREINFARQKGHARANLHDNKSRNARQQSTGKL